MTVVVGVGPGIAGAIAFIDASDGSVRVFDLPIIKRKKNYKDARTKTRIDAPALLEICSPFNIHAAWIEQVYASPQMGVVSAFTFGENFGAAQAVLSLVAAQVHPVEPNVWKSRMRVPADKEKSVVRACQLFEDGRAAFTGPKGGLKDGRAEACLIAFYGCLSAQIIPTSKLRIADNA